MNTRKLSGTLPAIGAGIVLLLKASILIAALGFVAVLLVTLYVMWLAGYNPLTGKKRGDTT